MRGADYLILTVNPGSTSTKIGVYVNDKAEQVKNLSHNDEELAPFSGRPILDQLDFRSQTIMREVTAAGYDLKCFDAVAGRGGLMRPLASGTYRVNDEMLSDMRNGKYGEHASNMGAFLAKALAQPAGAMPCVVDPVSVDEWLPKVRLSGQEGFDRQCLCHALNTKAVCKRYAREIGRGYADLRLVVAHLGSGITVSSHEGGRMIDNHNAGHEGTFSVERSGGIGLLKIIQAAFSGKYTEKSLWQRVFRDGGVFSYLGTRDLREVEKRIEEGDEKAKLVFEAMVYQIAKDIGGFATGLYGKIDAILLTGGMAHSKKLIGDLRPAIEWIAPVKVYPGEDELQALAEGTLRVLKGEEQAKELGPGAN